MDPRPPEPEAPGAKRAVLLVVMIASFLAPFMASAVNVALPDIAREFSLNAVSIGWVITAYLLSASVCLLPCGRLADLHGRRNVFLVGMAIATAGALLSGLARSAPLFLAARVLHGAGAAMGFATAMALLISVVPPRERGRALGWNVAAVYLGLSLGPVIGGVLTHEWSWRGIFWLNVALGLLALGLAWGKLRAQPAEAPHEPFDGVGSLLYGGTLVALMLGGSRLPRPAGALLLGASAVGFLVFVRWERRCRSPIFDVRLFARNRVFLFGNLAALINYAATTAVAFLLSQYLEYLRGLTAEQTGALLIVQPAVMTLFSPVAGRLSDRFEPGRMASAGMALAVVGLAGFAALGPATSLWAVAAGLGVLGLGFALFSSPNTNAVMSSVGREHYGTASGTLGTMRLVGQMLSMAVVMAIVALLLGRAQIVPQNHPAYLHCIRTSFAVFAGLCACGICASVVRGKRDGAAAV